MLSTNERDTARLQLGSKIDYVESGNSSRRREQLNWWGQAEIYTKWEEGMETNSASNQ